MFVYRMNKHVSNSKDKEAELSIFDSPYFSGQAILHLILNNRLKGMVFHIA